MRLRLSQKHIPLIATVAVCVLLYATASLLYRNFFTLRVFVNFLSGNSPLGIIAVGMTFVILSGGIDLSVGSVMALTGVVLAGLIEDFKVHPLLAIALVLLLGMVLGLGMGGVVRYFGLAPFIVTLAGMFFARGLALVLCKGAFDIQHPFYQAVCSWKLTLSPLSLTRVLLVVAAWTALYGTGRPSVARGGAPSAGRAFRAIWILAPVLSVMAGLAIELSVAYSARLWLSLKLPAWLAVILLVCVAFAVSGAMGLLTRRLGKWCYLLTFLCVPLARWLMLVFWKDVLHAADPYGTAIVNWERMRGVVGLPLTALLLLAVVAAGIYVAIYTRFGRTCYAVGGNEEAALLMGLPVGRTKLLVYALSGFCSALAGVVATFDKPSGDPRAGIGMELDAIAAVVVGGTLLTGGVGTIFGTLIGVLIFGVIQTGIDFQGNLNSWWTKVAIGVLLLLFILLQKLFARSGLSC